jgi:hypothetical protein
MTRAAMRLKLTTIRSQGVKADKITSKIMGR